MNLGKLFIIQIEFKVAKYNTEYLKIKLTLVRRCYLGMNIENELKEILIDKYNVEVNGIQKNLQSTIGNVYISNDNKYVIKIYNDIEHTITMTNLHNDMERKSVLHFDLTRNNIFIDNEQEKIGFIDFDDAKFGASVCDVAILVANLFFSKSKGANLEDMHKFIDAYYEEDLKIKEVEVPRIKEFALMWIDYVLDGNEFDASTTESFEVRKKLINRHL